MKDVMIKQLIDKNLKEKMSFDEMKKFSDEIVQLTLEKVSERWNPNDIRVFFGVIPDDGRCSFNMKDEK